MSLTPTPDRPGWQRNLSPSGGPLPTIGWTPELHGPDGQPARGFVPIVHELTILARYWASRIAVAEADMADGSYDPALARIERFAEDRLRELGSVLGRASVHDAVAMARAIHGKWEPGDRT